MKRRYGMIWSLLALVGLLVSSIAQAQVPTSIVGGSNINATNCSIAITTGGVAQNIITASPNLRGFILMNVDNTNGSGEPVWVSFTGTAAAGAAGSYALAAPTATTYAQPGSFASPLGFGTNKNVSVVAATTGHVVSCVKW